MPAPRIFPMLVGGRLRRASAGRGTAVPDGLVTTATAADVAEAVAAARAALPAWSGTGGIERGRVLHGIAELLDERRADDPPARDRAGRRRTGTYPEIAAAVDRWLWYAGWTDKIAGLVGAAQAVDGSASWSAPSPVGVVGVLAPPSPLGLVDALGPVLAAGATAVVLVPQEHPRGAAVLAEVLATADLPAGAANLLPGDVDVLVPALARAALDGLDLGTTAPAAIQDAARDAASRGIRIPPNGAADPALARLRTWSRTTTVWQPAGR